jgi:nucleoid DNA-binding protein
MQKSEFINKLAVSLNCSTTQAELSFNAVIKGLKDLLMHDNDLTIPGFGRFRVAHKAARQARNPKNGDALKLQVNNALKS